MPPTEHRVYVIKLDPKVLAKPAFRKANPKHDPHKPCVYVGSSSLPPAERFIQHKSRIKANSYARDYGLELLMSVMDRREPARTRLSAVRKEAAMARRLRRAGYAVWPADEALQKEVEKLNLKRLEALAVRAKRKREHRRKQAAARKAAFAAAKH